MKIYPENSAAAMARVLAMMMISDGKIDSCALDLMDRLRLYEILQISKESFIQVFHDYCADLVKHVKKNEDTHFLDPKKVNEVLDSITDPKRRMLLCGMALDISKSDHRFSKIEITLFGHMLAHWHFTLDDLETAFEVTHCVQ